MLDCQTEIESDFSAIHGIRGAEFDQLSSSQYFDWAELLPAYQGAVRVALAPAAAAMAQQPSGPDLFDAEPVDEVSPATLAAMSDHPGFPGIEYTGG